MDLKAIWECRLKRLGPGFPLIVAAFVWAALAEDASARSRMYDLNLLLDRPHPLANEVPSAAQRTTPVPRILLITPARIPPPAPTPRYVQPAPPPGPVTRRLTESEMALLAEPPHPRWNGAEFRLGGLIHDEGPITRNEEDGFNINLEILFPSPKLLEIIWSPRPHIGVSVNTEGDTSQAYFGLSWEWSFWGNWFAGFSLGGAVHDGELETNRTDRKELGCRLLFRQSVEFGHRFAGRHGISLFLEHSSNANICTQNEGLDDFGVRYGYRF